MMATLPNGNQDLNQMFSTNITKRGHPAGCNPNGIQANGTQTNQMYGLTNNLQPAMPNFMPTQNAFPLQGQTLPGVSLQGMCLPNTQPQYPGSVPGLYSSNLSNNNYNPFMSNTQPYWNASQGTAYPMMQPPLGNTQTLGPTPLFSPPNVYSPYRTPFPSVSPWNVNPWTQDPLQCGNVYPPFPNPSMPFGSNFPRVSFAPRKRACSVSASSPTNPPKPLGKLLFPTLYDFKHGSFFKMLIHMSGFEAKNINISANKNSLHLKAEKEEIEKQVQEFSGYILKQVERIYYFPEPIEESKIQISISEDVIGILIPWKQIVN